MDPFNGLGSTAVACARLGIAEFIGCDVDETYLEEAVARLDAAKRPRMAKAALRAMREREDREAGQAGRAG
jgi:DNA modification methylase